MTLYYTILNKSDCNLIFTDCPGLIIFSFLYRSIRISISALFDSKKRAQVFAFVTSTSFLGFLPLSMRNPEPSFLRGSVSVVQRVLRVHLFCHTKLILIFFCVVPDKTNISSELKPEPTLHITLFIIYLLNDNIIILYIFDLYVYCKEMICIAAVKTLTLFTIYRCV